MSKQFIAVFREPDGRTSTHTEEEIKQHREHWQQWFQKYGASGNITGGSSLTLEGKIILQNRKVKNSIYKNGKEIVGGFVLLNAESLEEATEIMQSCPIYEFDGYTEIREYQNQG